MACELVGMAGFEPAASSSRSQVPAGTTSVAACLVWDRQSMDVRQRPPSAVVIVTHLVTESLCVLDGLLAWHARSTHYEDDGGRPALSDSLLLSCTHGSSFR